MLVLGLEPRSSGKYSQCSYPLGHVYSPEFLYINKHVTASQIPTMLWTLLLLIFIETQERLHSGLYGMNSEGHKRAQE